MNIHLLKQEEVDKNKSTYDKTSPYINLIGLVGNGEVEFIFVTFYPEFKHQYDCYMNFTYDSERKAFNVDKLRIEVLVYNNNGKADHYAVYEDGKHVGDKPIGENKK